jgi:hypothetical protein
LLTSPTTTEPCLTASLAYSTWKMRPCGELKDVRIDNVLLIKWNLLCDAVVVVVIPKHFAMRF